MPEADDDVRSTLDTVFVNLETGRQAFSSYWDAMHGLATATLLLNKTVENGFAAVDRRFEAVDRRFEAVDRRFEAIDRRFDRLEQRVDKLDVKVDLIRDDMRAMGATMERILGYVRRDELKAHEVTEAS